MYNYYIILTQLMPKLDTTRFDYVFSYWIFLSYILFYFQILHYNPKYIIIAALFFTCIQILFFLWRGMNPVRLGIFLIINMMIKVIPLYTIWNKPVKPNDHLFYLGMFVFYISWLYSNDVDLKEIIQSYFSYNTNTDNINMPLTNLILNTFHFKT